MTASVCPVRGGRLLLQVTGCSVCHDENKFLVCNYTVAFENAPKKELETPTIAVKNKQYSSSLQAKKDSKKKQQRKQVKHGKYKI
jgi:hypothetical protein